VDQLLKYGSIKRLEAMQGSEYLLTLARFQKVHGVGSETARVWYNRGIRSIEEAKGAGVMTAQQLVGARHWRDLEIRIPRDECAQRHLAETPR
jgi:DNA polymerase lambda